MLDPVTTPLLFLVLGKLADEVIGGSCRDFLKSKLKGLFAKAEKLGSRDDLQLAYESAMQQAFETCGEVLLRNIETFGARRSELPQYRESLEALIRDADVAAELFRSIEDPNDATAPSHEMLHERWQAVGGRELPGEQLWLVTAAAYRSQAKKQSFLDEPLRDILTARNIDEIRRLLQQQGGVKTQVRRDKYSQRMRTKFSPVDLANLMPSFAEDPGRMVIRDVFVPQTVRENPPPVEIPKDLLEATTAGSSSSADRDARLDKPTAAPADDDLNERHLERLRTAYVSQSPRPVLDVIATAGNRLIVLTGEPGSGKSTLMRYLLTGVVEPPVDHQAGLPLPWTQSFEDAFPLLVELRDFYALRRQNECDSFLEYVDYMGKTDHWFLDQHAVNQYLETGPSLVMFDGLDEIFDAADRQRVTSEIAGFATRYPKARIVVTSRPVGYNQQVLRDAGFDHYGIQDLDDGQIESFIRGWFALTFPQQPQQAEQRIERVLGSVGQSKPIRLLAGNPMLLTIMALLAREEELPRERAKFYEKAVEVLCHHWDANRNLQLPEDRYLNADDKKALLRRIAMRMVTGQPYSERAGHSERSEEPPDATETLRSAQGDKPPGLKGNIIAEDDLEQEIQAFLIDKQFKPNAVEAKQGARDMIRQLRERNYILCLRGPHLYGFVHRTFLEYLTAAQYVEWFDKQPQKLTIDDLIALFDAHCREDDWREVLRLICGQIDEQFVGRIVEHLATRTDLEKWDGQTLLLELPLAIWCLNDIRSSDRGRSSTSRVLRSIIEMTCDPVNAQFIFHHILPACRAIESYWDTILQSKHDEFSLLSFLASVAGANRQVAMDTYGEHPRSIAVRLLVQNWPDLATRELLAQRTVQDDHESPRRAALQALIEKWPDEATRELLAGLAVDAPHSDVRHAALQALANKWPDEAARTLLKKYAVQDPSDLVKNQAKKLAEALKERQE